MTYSLISMISEPPTGNNLALKRRTSSPTTVALAPTIRKSKNARPVPVTSSRKLLTIKLVEVPIKVIVPPRMAA